MYVYLYIFQYIPSLSYGISIYINVGIDIQRRKRMNSLGKDCKVQNRGDISKKVKKREQRPGKKYKIVIHLKILSMGIRFLSYKILTCSYKGYNDNKIF